MSNDNGRSPAAKVMDEAIDLAIAGRSHYPDRAAFIDADTASAGHEIKRAADEGLPVVLVAADGSSRVLTPEAATQ
jgi:predicted urease superfamily metal-dependent hydrolase